MINVIHFTVGGFNVMADPCTLFWRNWHLQDTPVNPVASILHLYTQTVVNIVERDK